MVVSKIENGVVVNIIEADSVQCHWLRKTRRGRWHHGCQWIWKDKFVEHPWTAP